ncbi:DNA-binding response regulator, NarL/FixJ family, contains REC and HTH domains [Kaistia soli DSM 19436]|uniref:DNA-binding response regulator, NarL/FixJ family, contains REC and HTH domains n=2 Tax=Kaistia TaxID=166953 RepID=A0A1M4Y3J2_9HYPH|nr:DNA-binding response regulator, NarL/FixJ family, contains REC and HTH domains [Kaistia soli DSM 19436]
MLMNRHNSVPHKMSLIEALPENVIDSGRDGNNLSEGFDIKDSIAIIDENAFARDCLARCLCDIESDCAILTFADVDEWQRFDRGAGSSIVLLCAVGLSATENVLHRDLARMKMIDPQARFVIMSDSENPDQMLDAIEHGASGYIPSSIHLDVAVKAIRLVRAGGVFIPASALLKSRTAADQVASRKEGERSLFTARQAEVVKALRRGQPNKLIAYELNMGECTVKVHIRNIMKKLNARNRTEVAFMTNGMFLPEGDSPR